MFFYILHKIHVALCPSSSFVLVLTMQLRASLWIVLCVAYDIAWIHSGKSYEFSSSADCSSSSTLSNFSQEATSPSYCKVVFRLVLSRNYKYTVVKKL